MSDCVIAMKTPTDAERARRIALIDRIPCEIVNIDPSVTKRGCSIGLKFPCHSSDRLINLLERKNISYGDLIGRRD